MKITKSSHYACIRMITTESLTVISTNADTKQLEFSHLASVFLEMMGRTLTKSFQTSLKESIQGTVLTSSLPNCLFTGPW